ncbi:Hypothetical protein NTJ_10616 [Nesidiocoris tenuis]|uniref:Uncharacterized protein n=1 Tax=Nesidiocoris tenuis TaxID=355587 RepID=A0ABN7B2F3_9HEMI|nr:Hypothetical protein NTJ_10616 [Nesidiocoris tenuis]
MDASVLRTMIDMITSNVGDGGPKIILQIIAVIWERRSVVSTAPYLPDGNQFETMAVRRATPNISLMYFDLVWWMMNDSEKERSQTRNRRNWLNNAWSF